MQQSIIAYDGQWWNFFLDSSGALCFRVHSGNRWGQYEILLQDVLPDFSVVAHERHIHIVCQDIHGNILYLQYSDGKWQKTNVYESDSSKAYSKYFHLVTLSGYLNLFYILLYKERPMLVHQILGRSGTNVVDYVTLSDNPFCVVESAATELTVFYLNSKGTAGFKKYQWSKKDFCSFIPIRHEHERLYSLHAIPADGDAFHLCGIDRVDGVDNIAYMRCGSAGQTSRYAAVWLDAPTTSVPILLDSGGRLYILWQAHNTILYASSDDGGATWSKATRFIKGEQLPAVRYQMSTQAWRAQCYGYESNGNTNLLVVSGLLSHAPAADDTQTPQYQPQGRDVEKFAEESAAFNRYKLSEVQEQGKPYVTMQGLYAEVCDLKETVSELTKLTHGMLGTIHSLDGVEPMLRSQAQAVSQLEQRVFHLENYFIRLRHEQTGVTAASSDTPDSGDVPPQAAVSGEPEPN